MQDSGKRERSNIYFFLFVFYFLFILILVYFFSLFLDLDKECDVMSYIIVTQVIKYNRSIIPITK